jgi:hypothetical protein
MKVFAYHDPQGRISSLLASNGPEGLTLVAAAKPGELISEISADDFAELSGTSLISKLQETMASFEVVPHTTTIRRRSDS